MIAYSLDQVGSDRLGWMMVVVVAGCRSGGSAGGGKRVSVEVAMVQFLVLVAMMMGCSHSGVHARSEGAK